MRDPVRVSLRNKAHADQGGPSMKKQKRTNILENPIGSSSRGRADVRDMSPLGKQYATDPMESLVSITSDSSNHDTLLIHNMEQEALAAGEKFSEKKSSMSQDVCIQTVLHSTKKNTVGVLGTGVPRLACLRPAAWLKWWPSTARLHQYKTQDPGEGPSLAGRMTQGFLRDGLARKAREEAERSRQGTSRGAHDASHDDRDQAGARRAPASAVSLFPLWCKGASTGVEY